MKKTAAVILFVCLGVNLHAQFTLVPTGANTIIRSLDFDADTLIILGNQNYFAKSPDLGESVVSYPLSIPTNWVNLDVQVRNNMYYFMSIESLPSVAHVIKSSDRGQTWDNLYTVNGSYSNFTIIDTSFGVMGGWANYVVTHGSDIWTIDSAFSGITTSSTSYGDSTILFLTSGGFSYITMDRGATWDWGYCNYINHRDVQFVNKDTIYSIGFGGSDSDFSYSHNQGQNFINVMLGYNYQENEAEYHCEVWDMYFDSFEHGYIFAYMTSRKIDEINWDQVNKSVILETNDAGQNWIAYLTDFTEEFYSHVAYNDSISFIGGSNGLLLKWNRNVPLNNPIVIGTPEFDQKMSIYPNPFTDFAEINLEGITLPIDFELYDQTGRLIRTELIETSNYVLHRGSLKAGVYFYTLGNINGKLVLSE